MTDCLVVEDNYLSSTVISNQLAKLGVKSVVCADGQQAIDYCRNNPIPKLIMLDGYMPEMDGLEFLRQFAQLEGSDAAYIVFCSSSLDKPDIEKALSIGAHCHFPKPLSYEQVSICVEEAVKLNGLKTYRPAVKNHQTGS